MSPWEPGENRSPSTRPRPDLGRERSGIPPFQRDEAAFTIGMNPEHYRLGTFPHQQLQTFLASNTDDLSWQSRASSNGEVFTLAHLECLSQTRSPQTWREGNVSGTEIDELYLEMTIPVDTLDRITPKSLEKWSKVILDMSSISDVLHIVDKVLKTFASVQLKTRNTFRERRFDINQRHPRKCDISI